MTNSSSPQDDSGDDTEPALEAKLAEPRARLKRLEINRFRHVEPGTELRFDDGINVLLGRNGTGKTTLLELICALVSGDLRAYQREVFELEFELLLNGETIVVSAKNVSLPHKESSGVFGKGIQTFEWSYRIDYRARSGTVRRIEATKGRTQFEDSEHPESPLFAPGFYDDCIRSTLGIDAADFGGFRHQGILLTNSLIRLDEGLDVFRNITDGLALPRVGLPLAARLYSGFPWSNPEDRMRRMLGLVTVYVPASLVERLLEHGDSTHTATEISVSSDKWQLLDDLKALIHAKSLQVTLQLIERTEVEDDRVRSSFGKPTFRITTHRGTTYTHDQLSYGEKRLLTFMYHAAANPEILVADELVNGLHHEWIQACLDAIQGQAFLTSQNPLLLDHLSFESREEAQRRFVLCDRDEDGNWTWQNMDPTEASSFYRAYEVGVQHVSGILRTKGLW